MKQIRKVILCLVMMCMMFLLLPAAIPVQAAAEPTALKATIESVPGLTATWNDPVLTVTGSNDSMTTVLDLAIPDGVEINWQANIKATLSGG